MFSAFRVLRALDLVYDSCTFFSALLFVLLTGNKIGDLPHHHFDLHHLHLGHHCIQIDQISHSLHFSLKIEFRCLGCTAGGSSELVEADTEVLAGMSGDVLPYSLYFPSKCAADITLAQRSTKVSLNPPSLWSPRRCVTARLDDWSKSRNLMRQCSSSRKVPFFVQLYHCDISAQSFKTQSGIDRPKS